ncbi:MAG: zf-HC2 domain-containing protein [Acidobacteriia bacterium]|nr:zf-HC2 domain-containing protein [Terriglobia bacterium]
MNASGFSPESCEKTRRHFDAYLNNEMLLDPRMEVAKHLEGCKDCFEALESRTRLRAVLRIAVDREVVPAGLRTKIRSRLRETEPRKETIPFWSRWILVAAMAAVLCIAGVGAYRAWNLRHPASLSQLTASILKIGLGDHIHCAIDSQFAKRHSTLEEMSQQLGPEYFGLVSLAKEKVPAEFEIVVAHRCSFNGRKFVHLILRNQEVVLSLAITKKEGEVFPRDEVLAVMNASGVPLYRTNLQNMEVAGFETRDHLAFVVSGLSEKRNLQIASSLAPALRDFLAKLEG